MNITDYSDLDDLGRCDVCMASVANDLMPVFKEDNLVADGVLLEAYSVEDDGQGVSFCVYCYNVQPTVSIDYATGASKSESGSAEVTNPVDFNAADNEAAGTGVYRTPSGKRYHFDAECGGKNSFAVTMEKALNDGLTPCQKCAA